MFGGGRRLGSVKRVGIGSGGRSGGYGGEGEGVEEARVEDRCRMVGGSELVGYAGLGG